MADGGVRRVWLPAAILMALLLLLLLSRCAGDGASKIVGAEPGGAAPLQFPPPQPVKRNSYPTAGSAGTVLAAGGPVLPLAVGVGVGGDLTSFSGQKATGTAVRVQSVVADEGFWVGTSSHDRVYVQLVGPPPESPVHVRRGDRVSFLARVVPNRRGFARRAGVDVSEGADLLTAQGQHLAVRKRKLVLRHR